jgi:hypothetical protein
MDIEQRLARLEQENRRLKIIGLMALCVIAGLTIFGRVGAADASTAQQRTSDYITVKQITVVDDEGDERLSIGTACTAEDFPTCGGSIDFSGGRLADGTRTSFLSIDTVQGYPDITLRGQRGLNRLSLRAEAGGSPKVLIFDAAGNIASVWP